jgi:ribosome-associated protein
MKNVGWCPGKPLSMISIQIQTETIRLSQLLKLANVVQDGAEAKFRIANEEVRVNGTVEIRRGRKLRSGDRMEFNNETYEVVPSNSNN